MKRILFILSMLIGVAYGQVTGHFRYDSTMLYKNGGNNELILLNGTRGVTGGVLTNIGNGRTSFVTPATTKAKSGTTLSGDTVILGGTTLDRYSAIGLNGFPLTINHNAVNNANQSDSNSLRLTNNTAAAGIFDSLVSPAITFVTSGRKSGAGSGSRVIRFQMDALGLSTPFYANGEAVFRIRANVNNLGYKEILSIMPISTLVGAGGTLEGGNISSPLRINGTPIGSPTASAGNLFWGSSAAMQNNTALGGLNIGIGGSNLDSLTSGTSNVAIASYALNRNTTGENNIAIGVGALQLNTIGKWNTAVGHAALINNTADQNAAFGMNSLFNNTTGGKNAAFGAGSGEANTIGSFNSFIGHDAGLQNTTGSQNVGVGWLGNSQNRTGSDNTGIGTSSMRAILLGYNSVFIGSESGYLDTAGFNSQNDTVTNSMALGYRSFTTASNQIWIGNGSHNDLRAEGVVQGVGTMYMKYNPTTKKVTYDTLTGGGGGGGGSNFANADLTATGDRVHDWDGNNLTISNATSISFEGIGGGLQNRLSVSGTPADYARSYFYQNVTIPTISIEAVRASATIASAIGISPDSITIVANGGILNVPALRSGFIDTTLYKPLARKIAGGPVVQMNSWAQVSGGGGGSPTLTSTRVGYGDGSNVLTGEAAFTYDATNNVIHSDYANFGPSSDTWWPFYGDGWGYVRFPVRYNGVIESETGTWRINSSSGVGSFGTISPDASAKVEIVSTTQGFLPPRMTTTQKNAISSPAEGLVIYDLTLKKLCVYTGAAWETITSL